MLVLDAHNVLGGVFCNAEMKILSGLHEVRVLVDGGGSSDAQSVELPAARTGELTVAPRVQELFPSTHTVDDLNMRAGRMAA